jgi:hypothetical protein
LRTRRQRAISPAIATIVLIGAALAIATPAIMQMLDSARNSVPDIYSVDVDIVKLSASKAWFYVEQSDARSICVNIIPDGTTSKSQFCTTNKTLAYVNPVAVTIGNRYSVWVDVKDASNQIYATRTVSAIVR